MRVHGAFQSVSTFGKLNERWILPDWLPDIRQERLFPIRQIVERLDSLLNDKFQSSVDRQTKMIDPIESLTALSAAWPDSMSVTTYHFRLDSNSNLAKVLAHSQMSRSDTTKFKRENIRFTDERQNDQIEARRSALLQKRRVAIVTDRQLPFIRTYR